MWPFRRSQTPQDAHDAHGTVLQLIEQVTLLRGQVRALESEWDAQREQIKKGWQRLEKAAQRAERAKGDCGCEDQATSSVAAFPAPAEQRSFLDKWQAMKR